MPAGLTQNTAKSQVTLGPREREFASLIWRFGPLSRSEIQQRTGVHPTLTGNAVSTLIEAGLLREGEIAPAQSRGRPQVPIEIDRDRRNFLGLSISPGMVRVVRVDATGVPRSDDRVQKVGRGKSVIDAGADLLAEQLDDSVHSIGVSFTGLVDSKARQILFSSSLPSTSAASLEPIYAAAKSTPVVLHNDMHALAMRWLLTHAEPTGDVLLVGIDDGRLGASLLIDGRPHRGSVSAANELGHTRLAIETDRCYCGQVGCLERIVSTPQLARFGAKSDRSLDDVLADAGKDERAVTQVLDYLTTGLANAVNFIRPSTLTIAGPLTRHAAAKQYIQQNLPDRLLPGLRERTQLLFWEQLLLQSAQNAAWLALADVFGQVPDRQ